MKIITISAAHSGLGKTTLVEKLLERLKGWSALKVTVIKKGPCPRENPCGVCEDQKAPYVIISDPKMINQEGKDTQRMASAGAKKVLWLKATPAGLNDGLKEALRKFSATPGVVIEGTSILRYLKPDLGIYIAKKEEKVYTDAHR